jgi:hypothetical protein
LLARAENSGMLFAAGGTFFMNRAFGIAAVLLAATVLLPADAEARRRFSGSSSATSAPSTTTSRATIFPAAGASRAKASEADAPQRVPFPPATVTAQPEPVSSLLRLSSSDGKKPWCRSEVVVGGFCVVN